MAKAIVTTNAEKSAEAEVADCGSVKAKGRIVYCQIKTNYVSDTFCVRCPKRNSLFNTIGRIPTIGKK